MSDLVTSEKVSFAKLFNDCFSSQSGDYDPARLIGYGFLGLATLTFIGLFIFVTVKSGSFDAANFAAGVGVLCATTLSVAGGVLIKAPTENVVDYQQLYSKGLSFAPAPEKPESPLVQGE